MKIQYTIDSYDYLAFQMYHIIHSPFYRRVTRLIQMIPCCILIIIPVVLIFATQIHSYLSLIVYIGIAIIWYLISPLLTRFFIRLRLLRMIHRENMFFEEEKYILSFTDKGITETHHGISSHVAWNKIHHVAQTQSHIFIYFNPISAIIVPKRALKTKEAEIYFREKLLNRDKKPLNQTR